MEIYSFINSKDITEHCRTIGKCLKFASSVLKYTMVVTMRCVIGWETGMIAENRKEEDMGGINKNINYARIAANSKTIIREIGEYVRKSNMEFEPFSEKIGKRKKGDLFNLSDHVKGMTLSFLSSEAKWRIIQNNIDNGNINKIFAGTQDSGTDVHFDVERIEKTEATELVKALRCIKCGNRQIYPQMHALKDNIKTFKRWEKEYDSVDGFLETHLGCLTNPPADKVASLVKLLSESNEENVDKLWLMGIPLVCEYLRHVGIDLPKPDRHILRILSNDRLRFIEKTENSSIFLKRDVFLIFDEMHKATGMPRVEMDALLWNYCADGYSEICVATPKCNKCVVKKYCEKGH